MTKQTLKQIVGLMAVFGASASMFVACGDDDSSSSECGAGQVKASYEGETKCWDACDQGVCGVGETCQGGQICVPTPSSSTNQSTNQETNQGTNGETTGNTNGETTGNTNGETTGNTNGDCTPSSVGGACDPLCQTGCAGTQACVLTAVDPPASACVQSGLKAVGEVCSNQDSCVAGSTCVPETSTATTGVCRAFCRPSGANTCGAGEICVGLVQDRSLGVCSVVSDECTVVPNNCDEGKMCYGTEVGHRCLPYTENAMVGQTCMNVTDCGNNQFCVGRQGSTTTTCVELCDPANPACADGTTCNQLADLNGNALPYGACVS